MESKWRNAASLAIGQALGEFSGDLIYLNEDDHQTIKKLIDKAYPFGGRHSHPYKVWLDERRKVLVSLGIPVRQSKKMPPLDSSNQLSLFSTKTKRPRRYQK
jgi:hypothetical protein